MLQRPHHFPHVTCYSVALISCALLHMKQMYDFILWFRFQLLRIPTPLYVKKMMYSTFFLPEVNQVSGVGGVTKWNK